VNEAFEAAVREAMSAWQKSAATLAEALTRDPRFIATTGEWLSAGLAWKQASDRWIAQCLSTAGGAAR
jgi:hypothetical protein